MNVGIGKSFRELRPLSTFIRDAVDFELSRKRKKKLLKRVVAEIAKSIGELLQRSIPAGNIELVFHDAKVEHKLAFENSVTRKYGNEQHTNR